MMPWLCCRASAIWIVPSDSSTVKPRERSLLGSVIALSRSLLPLVAWWRGARPIAPTLEALRGVSPQDSDMKSRRKVRRHRPRGQSPPTSCSTQMLG
jgi:hypothetical protein